ncbi:MAG: hypothetical protein MUP81_01390 [Dehalococcoidia bacterium]|nr:hypothetical protein [Dehalococcoidia bacterium]
MRLLNKTKHSTTGLRIMLYDLAAKANISTRGVEVEVRRGSRNLHGVCYPYERLIILWLLNSSKTDDISFIWLHELTHLTPRNKKLWAGGHGVKAQRQADAVAEKVLGITSEDLQWHENTWRTNRFPKYPTKKLALTDPHNNRDCFPNLKWRLIRIRHEGKKWWVWQHKSK